MDVRLFTLKFYNNITKTATELQRDCTAATFNTKIAKEVQTLLYLLFKQYNVVSVL